MGGQADLSYLPIRNLFLSKFVRNMAGDAEEIVEPEIEEETEETADDKPKVPKHDSGVADLEKVTDFVEEEEISAGNLAAAINLVSSRQDQESSAKKEKEKELSKVKVCKDDVALIVKEMEISPAVAERKLKEHQGNVVNALLELTGV